MKYIPTHNPSSTLVSFEFCTDSLQPQINLFLGLYPFPLTESGLRMNWLKSGNSRRKDRLQVNNSMVGEDVSIF